MSNLSDLQISATGTVQLCQDLSFGEDNRLVMCSQCVLFCREQLWLENRRYCNVNLNMFAYSTADFRLNQIIMRVNILGSNILPPNVL